METSLQLEILLKLMTLHGAPLDKLTTLSAAADLWCIAAEKYNMPGIAQVLQLVIRGLIPSETDPVSRYIHAKLCGMEDLASAAMDACCARRLVVDLPSRSSVYERHIIAIMLERDRRVRHFLTRIRVRGGIKGGVKPLVDGVCACNHNEEQHPVPAEVGNRFREFALDFAQWYSFVPSVEAALKDSQIQEELEKVYKLQCKSSESPAYPAHRIREWLLRVEGKD